MITISNGEEENRRGKTMAHAIANEIFEYADERVGHAEGVPREELILACYLRLGELLGQWAKKLDRLEKVNEEPEWLRKFVKRKELSEQRPVVSYDSASLGFHVGNLFFAKERNMTDVQPKFSDDRILVSETSSMLKEDFEHLLAFCKENGLDFYVDGFGSKAPGRTFRLAIYVPKSLARSQLEFREKTLLAIKIFNDLSHTSTEKIVVERRAWMAELEKTGAFDKDLASKVAEFIIASKLVSPSLIID